MEQKFVVLVQYPQREETTEVPVYAPTIEEALALADAEYGADNVYRIRPVVTA